MHRRNFIKTTSLAGIGLSAVSLAACKIPPSEASKNNEPFDPKADHFELNEQTIDGLQQKMANNEYTSHKLTQLYIDRINSIDKAGPKLNAVIVLNPGALDMANALDDERTKGKVRGPMHGIPVLIKDNINTKDNMPTTAGSLALADNFVKEDAFIINKLREAGAVILGKTNLSEWANFRSTRSCSGWSSKGGQTKCPYILDRTQAAQARGRARQYQQICAR